MSFKLAPLSDFIRGTDKSPISRKDYQALTRPTPGKPTPAFVADLGLDSGKANPATALNQAITSSSPLSSLLKSVSPQGVSPGGGGSNYHDLYGAVGQLPAYKMQSLLNAYM